MKYFYKKIVNTPLRLILLPCILMLAGSCEEQPTDYRSFLEEKEIVYPAAVVRVEPGPGRYRVLLKWKRSPDPSVTEYGIYWNNSRDSSVVESISENASDTVEAYIGNLDEGVYSFTIYSFDKEGNRSIPLITENVKIYGDKYQGGLLNRQVSSIDYADGKTFLFWNRPDTINIHTEVSYTNQAGETQTFLVSPDSSSLLIPDWKPATKIFYRSTYKPERDAIDTFRVSYYDSLDVTGVPVDKSIWKQALLPGDAVVNAFNTSLEKIWDGSPGDYPNVYHSDGAAMPHTFTIDLGTTYRELSSFKEWGRTNNPGHNPVEFEVWGIADTTGATTLLPSADPGWKDESVSKGWTLLTDIERNDNGVAGIEYNLIENPPPVRFIRIRVLRSAANTPYSHMSEISFWFNP